MPAPLLSMLIRLQFMCDLVHNDPDLYLDELRDALAVRFGKYIHLTTVWRALKSLGLSLKRVRGLLHRASSRDLCFSFPRLQRSATPSDEQYFATSSVLSVPTCLYSSTRPTSTPAPPIA